MKEFLNKIYEHITSYIQFDHFLYLVGCLIILIGVSIIVQNVCTNRKNTIAKMISLEHDMTHLTVDLFNKTVYFFSRESLSDAKIMTLSEYLESFNEKNRECLHRWFYNAINPDISNPEYLELQSFSKKDKTFHTELFICRKANIATHKLHLDHFSYSLQSKKQAACPFMKEDYELDRIFYRLRKTVPVLVGLLSFFCTDNRCNGDYKLDKLLHAQILDILIKNCDKKHYLSLMKNGNIAFVILKYNEKEDTFLHRIEKELNRFYAVNAMESEGFHITYSVQKAENLQYKASIRKMSDCSFSKLQNHIYDRQLFPYQEIDPEDLTLQDRITAEVKNVLKNNQMIYDFIPVFNCKTGTVDSYDTEIRAANDFFKDAEDFLTKVSETGCANDYLATVVRSITTQYQSETLTKKRVAKTVVLHIRPEMMDSVANSVRYFRRQPDIVFILSMKSNEMVQYGMRFSEFRTKLENICVKKVDNLRFRIQITDTEFSCDQFIDRIQSFEIAADYFDTVIRDSQRHFLLSNLLTYLTQEGKPVVVTHVNDWTTYETLLCHRISYCSGKVFETENMVNPPVSKRISSRVKELYAKYY